MTETEAKERWCPMVRMEDRGADSKVAVNRPSGDVWTGLAHGSTSANGDDHFCIGSACMMWRTIPSTGQIPGDGYCGLAGKP